MSLDVGDLMTVIGKTIKEVNSINGLFATRESGKDAIYTVEAAESLQDDYAPLVGVYQGFYDQLASWIQQLIAHAQSILIDEEYVLDELPIFASDINTVLDALFDFMVDNTESLKASIVTLGGGDVDIQTFLGPSVANDTLPVGAYAPFIMLTRTLDGVNPPSSLVRPNVHYDGLEGQLAMSCTVFAKCVSGTPGSEVLQLFSDSPAQSPYTFDSEAPGNGPTIINMESGNFIANYDFSNWSGNNPISWPLTGGAAGTDWIDQSGSGVGPLRINTAGTYTKQKITGLERNRSYCFAALVQYAGSSGTGAAKMRIENVDGVTVHKNFGTFTCSDVTDPSSVNMALYGFYSPDDTVNLDDIYLAIEHDAESDTATNLRIYKVVAVPTVYFNGLGWAYWNPYVSPTSVWNQDMGTSASGTLVNSYGNVAIVNGNQGVIQTFFRRAFNVQLPTDDSGSETIADSLAT